MLLESNILKKEELAQEIGKELRAWYSEWDVVFQEGMMEYLYPKNVIKRIVYKPHDGCWYPYIDVMREEGQSQLSFFYGQVSVQVSEKRYCCGCFKEMRDEEIFNYRGVPVALCSNCFSKIYYGYWECLESTFFESLSGKRNLRFKGNMDGVNDLFIPEDFNNENGNDFEQHQICGPCEDFFNSRCGFPLNPELLNPCLKNHGIGLLMENSHVLRVMIGTLDSLKYQMIWNGGLFGVILGKKKQILNLALLSRVFHEVLKEIEGLTKRYNDSINGVSCGGMKGLKKNIRISRYGKVKGGLFSFTINEWLLLSYWSHDSRFTVKQRIQEWLMPSMEYLMELVKEIMKKHELEIVDYYDIMNSFAPFSENLGIYLEKHEAIKRSEKYFLRKGGCDQFDNFLKNLSANPEISFFNQQKFSEKFNMNNINRIRPSNLEIEEIMGAMGKFLIVKTARLEEPIMITTWDLIGKSFS